MTRIRRAVVLLSITAAVFFGGVLPADAQFSNSASAPTMAISNVDVLAPGNVSVAGSKCMSAWNNGTYNTRLQASVTWRASSTPGISGYLVTAVFSDGSRYLVAQVGPAVTSFSGNYDSYYATQNIRVTVTTLTSYGWTEESATSGVIKC